MRSITVLIRKDNEVLICKDYNYEVGDLIQISSDISSKIKDYNVEDIIIQEGGNILNTIPLRMPDNNIRITYLVKDKDNINEGKEITNLKINIRYDDNILDTIYYDSCTVQDLVNYISNLILKYNINKYIVNDIEVTQLPEDMSNKVLDIIVTKDCTVDLDMFIESMRENVVKIKNSYVVVHNLNGEVIEEIEVISEEGLSVNNIIDKLTEFKYQIDRFNIEGKDGDSIEYSIINVYASIREEEEKVKLMHKHEEETMNEEEYKSFIQFILQFFMVLLHLNKEQSKNDYKKA